MTPIKMNIYSLYKKMRQDLTQEGLPTPDTVFGFLSHHFPNSEGSSIPFHFECMHISLFLHLRE